MLNTVKAIFTGQQSLDLYARTPCATDGIASLLCYDMMALQLASIPTHSASMSAALSPRLA